jgi:hypothetical protein
MIFFSTDDLRRKDRQYRTTTESIAPSWIAISKLFKNSVWVVFSKSAVRIKWPVEDIGKNSVTPTIRKWRRYRLFVIILKSCSSLLPGFF